MKALTNQTSIEIYFTRPFVWLILKAILHISYYTHFIDKKTEAKVIQGHRGQ